jgi:hypothetical protein
MERLSEKEEKAVEELTRHVKFCARKIKSEKEALDYVASVLFCYQKRETSMALVNSEVCGTREEADAYPLDEIRKRVEEEIHLLNYNEF